MLLGLGAVGILARVLLWWISEGSNDIRTWEGFGWLVRQEGLGRTYRMALLFNHPPLMGLWAAFAAGLAARDGLTFAQIFKLPGLVAELATALLLMRVLRLQGRGGLAPAAFAAYGLALAPILISGYHGNTEPLYWFLSLLATYWMVSKDSPFLAGLALGAALEVKLIPLILAIPLAALCRDVRRLARYGVGLGIGLLPAVVLVSTFTRGQRLAFLRHVVGYRSIQEYWGVELIVRVIHDLLAQSLPAVARLVRAAGDTYAGVGGVLLMALLVLVFVWQWFDARRRLEGYALAALSYVLFLVFASGFGVQYAGAAVVLLVAWSPRIGFIYASVSGLLLAWVYLTFVTCWAPVYSAHYEWPSSLVAVAFLPWAFLVWVMVRLIRTAGEEGGGGAVNAPAQD